MFDQDTKPPKKQAQNTIHPTNTNQQKQFTSGNGKVQSTLKPPSPLTHRPSQTPTAKGKWNEYDAYVYDQIEIAYAHGILQFDVSTQQGVCTFDLTSFEQINRDTNKKRNIRRVKWDLFDDESDDSPSKESATSTVHKKKKEVVEGTSSKMDVDDDDDDDDIEMVDVDQTAGMMVIRKINKGKPAGWAPHSRVCFFSSLRFFRTFFLSKSAPYLFLFCPSPSLLRSVVDDDNPSPLQKPSKKKKNRVKKPKGKLGTPTLTQLFGRPLNGTNCF